MNQFLSLTRVLALLLPIVVGWGVSGCGRTLDPHAAWREVATQVSTYPVLAEGRYDGQIAVSNLVAYGDLGVGTFDGLDGELVLLTGVVHRVAADGAVSVAPPDVRIPFAQLTWFEPDITYDVMLMDQKLFTSTMDWKQPDSGRIQALRISGRFSSMHVRSVPRQTKPYSSLASVVTEQQVERTLTNSVGTMVGFFTPASAGTVAPGGFHLHYLSADGTEGGHVLNFNLAVGRIEIDETPVLHILLPDLGAK